MSVELGDLQIEQDGRFQQAEWRVQRLGWALLALLMLLAALGLFGNGPISDRTVVADGLAVEAQRFARAMSPQTLTVHVAGKHAQQGDVTVLLSRDLVDTVEIQHVTPTPAEVRGGRDDVAFVFRVAPGADLTATFAVRASAMGRVDGQVAVPDGTEVDVWQLHYP